MVSKETLKCKTVGNQVTFIRATEMDGRAIFMEPNSGTSQLRIWPLSAESQSWRNTPQPGSDGPYFLRRLRDHTTYPECRSAAYSVSTVNVAGRVLCSSHCTALCAGRSSSTIS
jgi:hypothetical protein